MTTRLFLRQLLPVALLALTMAACDQGPTEYAAVAEPTFEAVLEANGNGDIAAGFLEKAPEALRLTDAQKTQIKALNESFRETNKADFEALRAITREAMQAKKAGKSQDEVRAILEKGKPIRDRMTAAMAALRTAINGVLTEAQKAWLWENAPKHGPRLPNMGGPGPGAKRP
jgi:Spy/CpxP family protein refolding chaperone